MGELSSSWEPELKRTHMSDKLDELQQKMEHIHSLQSDPSAQTRESIDLSLQSRLELFYKMQHLLQRYPTKRLQLLVQNLCRTAVMYAQQHHTLLNDQRLVTIALGYQQLFSSQEELIKYYEHHGIGTTSLEFYRQAGAYYEFQARCTDRIDRALHYYTHGYNMCEDPKDKLVFKRAIDRLTSSECRDPKDPCGRRLFVWAAEASPPNLRMTELTLQLDLNVDGNTDNITRGRDASIQSAQHIAQAKPMPTCRTLPIFVLTYNETDNSFISPEEQHLLDIHMRFMGRLIARKQMEHLNPYSQLANDPHIISRMIYTLSPRHPILLYTSKQGPTPNDLVITSIIEPYYLPRAFYFALVDMAPSLLQRRLVLTFIEEVDTFPASPERGSTLMICPYQSLRDNKQESSYPIMYPQVGNDSCDGIDRASSGNKVTCNPMSKPNSAEAEIVGQQQSCSTDACNILLTLTDLLGTGAFGKVFAADAFQSGHPNEIVKVAVKFFTRKKDSIVVQIGERPVCAISTSFLREIYTLAALTLRLADSLNDCLYTRFVSSIVDTKGLGAFVMEYIPGVTLFELCKHYYSRFEQGLTCLPEDVILWITYMMIKTVKALHAADIVHTDIKVDNWLVALSDEPSIYRQYVNKLVPHIKVEEEIDMGTAVHTKCQKDQRPRSATPRAEDAEDDLVIVPIACDFGKAVDASLFTLNDTPVHFYAGSLSVVVPCPIVTRSWLYEADYAGIASCVWFMLMGSSLKQKDIEIGQTGSKRRIDVRLLSKRYWRHVDLLIELMSQLLSFTTEDAESYASQRQQADVFANSLLQLVEGALNWEEVIRFSARLSQDKALKIDTWHRNSV